jgi:hypothetical protein
MSLSEQVLQYVRNNYVGPARQKGESTIRIVAGDIHRDLRWTNRVPSVCTTLASRKFQQAIGAELIAREGPPSGFGTRAAFTYRLPKEDPSRDAPGKGRGSLLELYGIAADVFRDLGGGGKFIREERKNLDFRYDAAAAGTEEDEK